LDTETKKSKRTKRSNYPLDFKKRLAKAACVPDVSVSQLALEHGINVNMLFKWRRHYRAGLFDAPAVEPATLLPVSVIESRLPSAPIQTPGASYGTIEIKLADAVVRVDGHADAATLRAVLQILRP
jgi:transposase